MSVATAKGSSSLQELLIVCVALDRMPVVDPARGGELEWRGPEAALARSSLQSRATERRRG